MSIFDYRERIILKGGLLLAAFDARRATRDGDLLAHINRGMEHTMACICEIARIEVDDGVTVLRDVLAFTEPLLSQPADGHQWVPTQRRWIDPDRT